MNDDSAFFGVLSDESASPCRWRFKFRVSSFGRRASCAVRIYLKNEYKAQARRVCCHRGVLPAVSQVVGTLSFSLSNSVECRGVRLVAWKCVELGVVVACGVVVLIVGVFAVVKMARSARRLASCRCVVLMLTGVCAFLRWRVEFVALAVGWLRRRCRCHFQVLCQGEVEGGRRECSSIQGQLMVRVVCGGFCGGDAGEVRRFCVVR